MKATNYVRCVLVLACFAEAVRAENSRNKIQQQYLDPFTTDESLKMKRPFCNAFTGCGTKRSYEENQMDVQDPESSGSIRLPLSVYKALLRAASQRIRNAIGRDVNDYRLSEVPEVYLSNKQPLHKRLDVPSGSLD